MFWKGRVSLLTNIQHYLKQSEPSLLNLEIPQLPANNRPGRCIVSVSSPQDVDGIARLLNEHFEEPDSRAKAFITADWIRDTYTTKDSIWIVAKDIRGTVRGCVASFKTGAPYNTNLPENVWGLIDWYCVHPLWRSKGVGSALLEVIDFITYRLGRKAHIFFKEGIPLPLPHIPIHVTWLQCRKAGSPLIKELPNSANVELYHTVERKTGLPLLKVFNHEGKSVREWENSLDTELPECWVFVESSSTVDYKRGWKTDSLISMYAFRWTPGKFYFAGPIETATGPGAAETP